jgi:putative PIN family toxin of toxin-antitoxin system
MTPARIVVDTNVIVAALTSPAGSNRAVLRCCLAGVVEPLIGTALFHEYESIISRKSVQARCPLQPMERDELLNAFLGRCVWVRISFRWRPNLADESDNHLMELAVAGGAATIITNNVRDLTSGELIFPDIKIMTPSSFLKTVHAKTTRRRP